MVNNGTREGEPGDELTVMPRYDLGEEEIAAGEAELTLLAYEQLGDREDVFAIWIRPRHPLANVVRSIEKQEYFDEIPDVMDGYEDQSMFLALLDTRGKQGMIAHIFRISGAGLDDKNRVVAKAERDSERTGIILIDDMITSGQNFTAEDFYTYYQNAGVDVDKCISVETNLRRKGEKPENYNGLPLSQVGYISLFKLVESKGLSVGEAAIFAHLNKAAIVSLQAVGAEYEPIAGREDLKTPTILADGSKDFDFDYKPVAIPATPQNLKVFGELTPFAAPQMTI